MKSLLNVSVSASALETLNDFLLTNNAHMNLTEAHGLLCAVWTSLNMIMPSQWHPLIFGEDFNFERMEDVEQHLGTLMALYNRVGQQLRGEKPFEILLFEQGKLIPLKQAGLDTVAQWCSGYIVGTKLEPAWGHDEFALVRLFPMGVLSGKFSLVGEKSPAGEIIEDDTDHKLLFKEGLEEFVVELYAYWRERESELESFDDERLPSRKHYNIRQSYGDFINLIGYLFPIFVPAFAKH